MKVLVLGDGLLGKEIVSQTGWNYISRKKDSFDISKIDEFKNLLEPYDVLVNCIAFTKTYENNKEESWKTNIKFVDNLIEFCNFENKKLVHISTDYIYAGSVPNASEEDVPVHINTWYGYTKLVGDALVQLRSDNYIICRLSHKPNPFPYESAWTDIHTNCDSVDIISSIIISLINKNGKGIFNVGTEIKSIYDLALKSNRNVTGILKPSYVPNDITMNINKLKSIL
jgi:nucleoside-diphosphate-sugar epimerase